MSGHLLKTGTRQVNHAKQSVRQEQLRTAICAHKKFLKFLNPRNLHKARGSQAHHMGVLVVVHEVAVGHEGQFF